MCALLNLRREKLWLATLLAAGMLACAACNEGRDPLYPAGGTVAFPDGRPVPGGRVSFRAIDTGSSSEGQILPDGRFKLTTYRTGDGAIAGRHQTLVVVPRRTAPPGMEGPTPLPAIDPKYSNFETSGLAFTVGSDPSGNEFSIVVTPPVSKR